MPVPLKTDTDKDDIRALKAPEALARAASTLGLTLTDEMIEGVTGNLDLLASHYDKLPEVKSGT